MEPSLASLKCALALQGNHKMALTWLHTVKKKKNGGEEGKGGGTNVTQWQQSLHVTEPHYPMTSSHQVRIGFSSRTLLLLIKASGVNTAQQ